MTKPTGNPVGRPPTWPKNSKPMKLWFRVGERTANALREIAAQRGVTYSIVVRELLDEALAEQAPMLERQWQARRIRQAASKKKEWSF